jgi:leukotriene-A4 hydrolase
MLRFYLNKYRGMSITYLEFRLTFNEWIRANYPAADAEQAIAKVDWNAWVLSPGPNPVQLDFSTPNATKFSNIALDYISRKGQSSAQNYTDYKTTDNPNLKVIFLDTLVANSDSVVPKVLTRIDQDLDVTDDPNPEIGQRWFPLAIQFNYMEAFPKAKNYTQSIGRQKYIIPVYRALVSNGYRNLAYQWYDERKNFYHPITAKKIRAIIFSSVYQGVPQKEYVFEEEEGKFL